MCWNWSQTHSWFWSKYNVVYYFFLSITLPSNYRKPTCTQIKNWISFYFKREKSVFLPLKRYGWATHFRSWLRTFWSVTFLPVSLSNASETKNTEKRREQENPHVTTVWLRTPEHCSTLLQHWNNAVQNFCIWISISRLTYLFSWAKWNFPHFSWSSL